MRNIVKKAVTDKSEMNSLYLKSALTWEGMLVNDKNLNAILDWMENLGVDVSKAEFRITSGKMMNEAYCLTGDNAYSEDLNIVSVINVDICPLVFRRFAVGGRWFDDIVDNNARREREKR